MDKIFKNKIIELLKTQMPNLHKSLKEFVKLSESNEELSLELLEALLQFHEPYLEFVNFASNSPSAQLGFADRIKEMPFILEPKKNELKPAPSASFKSETKPALSKENIKKVAPQISESESFDSEIEDDDASALLDEMESKSEINEETDLSSISDDDAMKLLAEMDAPVKNSSIDEPDEAMELLEKAENSKSEPHEIDEDEAMKLLAEMDSPVQNNQEIDDEALKLLADMDAPPAQTKPAAAKPTKKQSTDDDDDLMALLNEVGGAETSDSEDQEVSSSGENSSHTQTHNSGNQKSSKANSSASGHGDHEAHHSTPSHSSKAEPEIEEFSGNEFANDPEMMKDFLSNADDLMENLDNQILALEQNPNSKDVIEEIFRAAHTLKGAAGMFGFKALERVMHRLENYFDLVRKQKTNATPDTIDVVFEAMDVMKKLLQGVRDSKPSGVLTGGLVAKLNQVCAGTYVKSNQSQPAQTSKNSPQVREEARSEVALGSPSPSAAKSQNQQENSTIKVDIERLDALVNLVGELVIDRGRFINIEEDIRALTEEHTITAKMSETVQLFGRHMNEIQDIIMKVRMVPIGNTFNKFTRIVRDLSRQLDKNIELIIIGEDTELDKTLVEQLGDPLVHLIRNACDHGCETPEQRKVSGKSGKATIELSARQEGNQIIIAISDDGKGMDVNRIKTKAIEKGLIKEDTILTDKEIFNLIFEPGFSTVDNVTNLSGRGVGMDVVKRQIAKLKGEIDIQSTVGKGSTITINLPLTLAIVQSLLVKSKTDVFAIPLSAVVESIRIHPSEIQKIGNAEVIKRRDNILPLVYLNQVLDLDSKDDKMWYSQSHAISGAEQNKSHKRLFVVVIGTGEKKFGIVVDYLLNQQEMVIKPMGRLRQIPCVAGGAILGNGEAVLVLDIAEIESFVRQKNSQRAAA
jgi:two-component system chemotaxis sensor kinase CheA